MRRVTASPLKILAILLLVMSLGLTSAVAANVSPTAPSRGTSAAEAAKVVAASPQGRMNSRIVGETANGHRVTGSFVPVTFVKKPGRIKVRGMLLGVVHRPAARDIRFSGLRTMTVKTIEGVAPRAGASTTAARARCDILNLVLGPLDLDLLGLEVHLNRVVLDIIARSGAGNLLGNLLCAVAGLLDGPGGLGQITRLLNRILGLLRLGV